MNFQSITDQVVNGEIDALKAFVELKKISIQLDSALKIVQPLAISEADNYPEKSFKAFGAIIEKRSAACTWDYSQCAAYQQAKTRLKYIEDIAKAGGGYDSETTEEIGKAIKIEGKSTIAISIPK